MRTSLLFVLMIIVISVGLYLKNKGHLFTKKNEETSYATEKDTVSKIISPDSTEEEKPFSKESIKSKTEFENYLVGEWEFKLTHNYSTKNEIYNGKIKLNKDGTFTEVLTIDVYQELSQFVILTYKGKITGTWHVNDSLSWNEIVNACDIKNIYTTTNIIQEDIQNEIIEDPCDYIGNKLSYGNTDTDDVTSDVIELTTSSLIIEGKNYLKGYKLTNHFSRLK